MIQPVQLGSLIDDDCDYTTSFNRGGYPHIAPSGIRRRGNLLAMVHRLTQVHLVHLEAGIAAATLALADSVVSGKYSLCDDRTADALYCKQQHMRLGHHPPLVEVGRTVNAVLGMRSSYAPDAPIATEPAAMRSKMLDAAHSAVCGEPHEVTCGILELRAFGDALVEHFDRTLTDGARLMVRRAAVAYRHDVRLLSTPAIASAFRSRCAPGPVAIAQEILGRSAKDSGGFERRIDVAHRFNQLMLITPSGTNLQITNRAEDLVRANVIAGVQGPAPAPAEIGSGFQPEPGGWQASS